MTTFRKADLLRAALQENGMQPDAISQLLDQLRNLAKSSEHYNQWNRALTDSEIQLLAIILTPNGAELRKELISTVSQSIVDTFEISSAEIQAWLSRN